MERIRKEVRRKETDIKGQVKCSAYLVLKSVFLSVYRFLLKESYIILSSVDVVN